MSSYQEVTPFLFILKKWFQHWKQKNHDGWPSDLNFRKVPRALQLPSARPHLEVDEAVVVLEDFAGALGELGGVTGKEVGRDIELDGNVGTDISCELPWKKTKVLANPKNLLTHPVPSIHGKLGENIFLEYNIVSSAEPW